VGRLAQNPQGVYFQYAPTYLDAHPSLAPYSLSFDAQLHKAPFQPHGGLHGLFADALPDGWGRMLMERVFRQAGIFPEHISHLARLAYMGDRASGALEFRPETYPGVHSEPLLESIQALGEKAQMLFEGESSEWLAQIAKAGGSAGARPKAQVYLDASDLKTCAAAPRAGFIPTLVKFTSQQFPLGHEEGLCEAAYFTLAHKAGIQVPQWSLIRPPEDSAAIAWLAMQRFDRTAQGKIHLLSACALLDADFRLPSLDYLDLIKATSILCQSPMAGQMQFRRAVFNYYALNQDDHTKNTAFLQEDNGAWQLSPAYDLTYSPSLYGEHAMAYGGYGKDVPLKTWQALAAKANFSDWARAKQVIEQVKEALAQWPTVARELGVRTSIAQQIATALARQRLR
jgi:serine/threonine-protein kinase HipA